MDIVIQASLTAQTQLLASLKGRDFLAGEGVYVLTYRSSVRTGTKLCPDAYVSEAFWGAIPVCNLCST